MEKKYYIVRGDRSGVFFGEIEKREGREVTMRNVRRLWHWRGATECCQLAAEGVKAPYALRLNGQNSKPRHRHLPGMEGEG